MRALGSTFYRHGRWSALALLGCLCAASLVSCSTQREPDSSPPPRESFSARVAAPVRERDDTCEMTAWVDLGLARDQEWFVSARDRILGSVSASTFELARTSGIDIERSTQHVRLCETRATSGSVDRVLWFEGEYPANLLERITKALPGATSEAGSSGALLHVASAWIGRKDHDLVWSTSRSSLELALTPHAGDVAVDHDSLLLVRMAGRRLTESLAPLGKRLGADTRVWNAVTIAVSRNGSRSTFQVATRSSADATALLHQVRTAIHSASEDEKSYDAAFLKQFSVEASDATVTIQCEIPFEKLIGQLTRLNRKVAPAHR